jgi:AcrR family transcriptional regulator
VRREPTQRRSRQRVEQIFDAAADLIVELGVEGLSTRAIAARAGIPVSSVYQYFADRDEIILALVQRDTVEMDERVAEAVASLDRPSVRSLVEATMRAFVAVYHRRPEFVVIWWRGRTNAAVYRYCREHNRRIAKQLHDFAVAAGLMPVWTQPFVAELAVEVGDRLFELAFERELRGDSRIIAEGIELVTGYLERYAGASVRKSVP